MEADLSVEIAGIRMKNPVMPASGTFGYDKRLSSFDLSLLGAMVTKGTTLEPREGNDPPRICKTAAGMINFIGLENPGAKRFIQHMIPELRKFGVPIIVNICGAVTEEYEALARMFDNVEGIAGLEVNISCPNTKEGGVAFGQDPRLTSEVVGRVRKATKLPLIVKLTPNVTNIVVAGRAAVEAGADALSLVNTLKARARIRTGPGAGRWIEGGLSGPAIMPVALKMVSDLAKAKLGVPIIGIGGISSLENALDFFESGADAIQVGTANFINQRIMLEIIEGLRRYLQENGFTSFREFLQKSRNP
jgi:dihydroorotate dehydrogenase (NAD+) catalytic subunit